MLIRCFLTMCLTVFFMGCGEDSSVTPVVPAESVGLVSGTITNARTDRPVGGAVVELSGRQWESDAEGKYSFDKVDFSDAITITVEALDYARETLSFELQEEHIILDIPLNPLTNPDSEIRDFLDTFSELIATIELDNLEAIEELFAEDYLASDDLVTRFFGLNTGVIPANYDAVIPAITALFEEFNLVHFRFYDVEMNVPHTRQASAKLGLDVVTEKGRRSVRREIVARCELYFRKQASDWKVFFWQFLEADVHL